MPFLYFLTFLRNKEELTRLRHLELSVANEANREKLGKFLKGRKLREYQPDSECEMLSLAQDDTRPGVRKIPGGAREGIELAFTYGTGANERTFTLELECDEDGGDEEPGEVEGDGNDVSAVWLTDATCGAGPGPPPGPDPDPDPDPEPEPGPCVSPSPSSFSLAWECA